MLQRGVETMKPLSLFVTITFALSLSAYAQPEGEDIVVGRSVEMPSKIYDKDIALSVVLPSDYAASDEKYPVLFSVQTYFLHVAGSVEHLSRGVVPKMIYVHVETYDSGDLIPTAIESRPGSGGADRLISFFKNELIPFVDSNYRTHPFRIVLSSSWGGVFCLYTLLTQPEVFNGYIAATPWFIYDGGKQFMLENSEDYLTRRSFARNFLFMAISNDPDPGLHESFDAFATIMNKNPKQGLKFHHVSWPDEDHWSISHKAVYDGLKWIFRDWREIPEDRIYEGVSSIKHYRTELEALYGYDIGINSSSLRMFCNRLRREKRYDDAIKLYKFQIELGPDSPYLYEGLGRTYEAMGDWDRALQIFQKARDLAEKLSVSDRTRFDDHIDRVREKMQKP
jgi:predicted alpha/beta superfamily hydrolase